MAWSLQIRPGFTGKTEVSPDSPFVQTAGSLRCQSVERWYARASARTFASPIRDRRSANRLAKWDDGIDGIIKEDKLGLDVVYIQAKRWKDSVGRPVVQAFAGSLEGVRARKGVFITTSTFTADAVDYVQRIEKKIVLVDGTRLADLMIEQRRSYGGTNVHDQATGF